MPAGLGSHGSLQRGAAFFDRDNTLIDDAGYTHKTTNLAWAPGAIAAIRACNDAGRLVFVVSNQSGVARGYYGEEDVRAFHAHMQAELAKAGAHVDAFYYCPFHGEGAAKEYVFPDHPDRKPNPGMLRRALQEWPLDVTRSFVIGDSDIDIEAAAALNLPARKVAPGELADATRALLAQTHQSTSAPHDIEQQLKTRAVDAKTWLFEHAFPLWWDRGFDRSAGCWHERLALGGAPVEHLVRRTRVQARQTIVYARAGRLGWHGPWREAVETGVRVLLERCIRPDGGTRHTLASDGGAGDERRDLYDLAFVVLALSEAAKSLNAPALLAAAEQLVSWLEQTWAHPRGGFFEGEVVPAPPRRQNPHMHLFEALLALFEASGDAKHLARASNLACLIVGAMDAAHGALPEFFDDAWRPAPGAEGRIIEPGHQFEWSWLLQRWRALGGGEPSDWPERLRVNGEVYGVDFRTGFTHDEVWIEGAPRLHTARLWPQTERLRANAVRYKQTGDLTAAACAIEAFDVLMRYCDTPLRGMWRDRHDPTSGFAEEAAPASSFYHILFALEELLAAAEGL
jgi:histidinol-phosphate phosphatase family protein